MSVFVFEDPVDPQESNPSHAASAAAVFRQPAFKAEIDYGVQSCYQQCMEAIKVRDYVKAEVMHDVAKHLQELYSLFERLHDNHVQTLKLNQESPDESSS